MATTDAWLGGTHSFSVSRNWSDGVPTSDSNVVIPSGDARVTSPFAVNAVQVKAAGTMTFVDAGATRTMAGSINSGTLALDTLSGQGGSSLDIGGALKNYGLLQVGASDGSLSAADKVSVVSLVNDKNGVISLDGGGSALAGLVVGSTAGFGTQGLLTGDVSLGGYARLTFAGTGQITKIASGASLSLDGPHALMTDAGLNATSNSALNGLASISGTLDLADGAKLATTGALQIGTTGTVGLDGASGQSGGTRLDVGGTLTVDGTLAAGAAGDVVSAASLENRGQIDLAANAQLTVAGALKNDGAIDVNGGAEHVTGAVTGHGSFDMDGGSSLRFDAAVGQYQTVSFSHTTASETDQLILEAPTSFDATIAGFDKDGATGDTIVGVGFGRGTTLAYTENANFSGGSLTLADGGKVAHLAVSGAYVAADFSLAIGPKGDSIISYHAPTT